MKNQRASFRILLLLVVCISFNMQLDIKPAKAQSQNYFVYLPLVSIENQCGFNAKEQTFADIMINVPDQQRALMVCDPILAQVACDRAIDMGTRNYFSHTNPDGYGPSYLVQQAGYILPSYYSQTLTGINIESICGGSSTDSDA